MIEVENLEKKFGKIKVLKGVSFSAEAGEPITLLGPNGAGKTTLMRILCGYLTFDGGTVKIDGAEYPLMRNDILRKVGYMPENSPLYTDMTVAEYLHFTARVFNMKSSEFADAFQKTVEGLELASVIHQKTGTLSKGYKRRVGIASVLLHSPKYVILDEPTEGLDPNQKIVVRKYLKKYAENNLVLISTHLLEEAEALNSRILLLSGGKIKYDGNVGKLREYSDDGTLADAFYHLTKETTPDGENKNVVSSL